jgi:TatD DNase family protein
VRDQSGEYEGYSLWLKEGEPSAEQVISEMGDPKAYGEIVFCGYGEPTYRLDAIIKISEYVHANGGKTRMNTNGHGNVINGRDITVDLAGRLDGINISLNAPDEKAYDEVCRPHIKGAYDALKDFASCCKKRNINCWFSVVDCIGEEALQKCREVAKEVGIPLRVREYIG